jgi:hypothetical protein
VVDVVEVEISAGLVLECKLCVEQRFADWLRLAALDWPSMSDARDLALLFPMSFQLSATICLLVEAV